MTEPDVFVKQECNHLFFEIVSLVLDLNFDLGTKENILPQGIHIGNIKAASVTIQKFWPMPKSFTDSWLVELGLNATLIA